ncbi:MAG: PDZ domain-containing protein [Bacillota bacterium]
MAGVLVAPFAALGYSPTDTKGPVAHGAPTLASDGQMRPGTVPVKHPVLPRDEPGNAPTAAPTEAENTPSSYAHTPSMGVAPGARQTGSGHTAAAEIQPQAAMPPETGDMAPRTADAGLKVRALTDEERHELGIAEGGIKVLSVGQGNGQQAGFRAGDVVLSLDGVEITSTAQFHQLLRQLPHDRPVPVLVHRPNNNLFLPLDAPHR